MAYSVLLIPEPLPVRELQAIPTQHMIASLLYFEELFLPALSSFYDFLVFF